MIDTLYRHIGKARALPLPPGLAPGEFTVVTLHRPSNVDDARVLGNILGALGEVADRMPVVFPAHPRTADRLDAAALHPNVRLVQPLAYIAFLGLVANTRMVLTDSGGIQEETTVLGVPCITMRDNTERPITCEAGTNILAGNAPAGIRRAIASVLANEQAPHTIPPKWDGHAAERSVDVLLNNHHCSSVTDEHLIPVRQLSSREECSRVPRL
jgi:UDP-N-acetylglucosamine 2-epimerase (non-hydrolysing)